MAFSDEYKRPPGSYLRPPRAYYLSGGKDFWCNGFLVAGVFYQQQSIRKLPLGYDLLAELIPESENPYDFNAVCVEVDGLKIGYLPRGLACFWHDIIVRLNVRGFFVQTLCYVEKLCDGDVEYGVRTDLPSFDQWGSMHAEVGFDEEFFALRSAVTPELWQRLLDNCWDEVSDGDHRALAIHKNLVPSAKWRESELERGVPTIPERLIRRFREELLAGRRRARIEAEREREQRRAVRIQQGREFASRRKDGLTYAQIAVEFDVTPYMVKKLLSEAANAR